MVLCILLIIVKHIWIISLFIKLSLSLILWMKTFKQIVYCWSRGQHDRYKVIEYVGLLMSSGKLTGPLGYGWCSGFMTFSFICLFYNCEQYSPLPSRLPHYPHNTPWHSLTSHTYRVTQGTEQTGIVLSLAMCCGNIKEISYTQSHMGIA